MAWELAHNANGLPIHANGGTPHITVRDADAPLGGATYHIPYVGQTTLGMFGIGQAGESMEHVANHNLGGLDATNATFTPWLNK